jgi:hypothetical protein
MLSRHTPLAYPHQLHTHSAHRHDHSSRAHTVVRVRVESAKISGRPGGATPRAASDLHGDAHQIPACELSPSYLDPEPGEIEPRSPAASLPAHFAAATAFSDPSTPPRVGYSGLEPQTSRP